MLGTTLAILISSLLPAGAWDAFRLPGGSADLVEPYPVDPGGPSRLACFCASGREPSFQVSRGLLWGGRVTTLAAGVASRLPAGWDVALLYASAAARLQADAIGAEEEMRAEAVTVGASRRLAPWLAAGTSFKWVSHRLGEEAFGSPGADAGAEFFGSPGDRLSLRGGVSIVDALPPRPADGDGRFPTLFLAGGSVTLALPRASSRVSAAVGGGIDTEGVWRGAASAGWRLLSALSLSAGYDFARESFGAGASLDVGRFRFGYAFSPSMQAHVVDVLFRMSDLLPWEE